MENKKIVIAGLGPVGMILAIHLKEAGYEVALFDRNRIKTNQIKREGIRLSGVIQKQASFSLFMESWDDIIQYNPDFVIFSLKTYQVKQTMEAIRKKGDKWPSQSLFISAQNGIDAEKIISESIGEARTLRMVINFAGNLHTLNEVNTTFFNPPNYIASIDDSKTKEATAFAQSLSQAGLHTEAMHSFEIIRRIWEKTILNASLSAICGVGRMTMKEAMEDPDTVEIVEQIIEEGVQVAAAEKIFFEDDFVRKCMRYIRKTGNHFPSLAVDMVNNRETEIDYLNGKIVWYGKKHYIKASLNLVLTNTVRAITRKALASCQSQLSFKPVPPSTQSNGSIKNEFKQDHHYLGIDLGSAYTKFSVVNQHKEIRYQTTIRTHDKDRGLLGKTVQALREEFDIKYACATGYGRKTFSGAELTKTEINCAAVAVGHFFPGEKNIIDIGGEDIKVIKCNAQNEMENFYMNDKCAAGTGSFLVEIADKAGISPAEMSNLAEKSMYPHELNSFCTVFAKTEIMNWMFEGKPVEDIAKGIYLSIASRVSKLKLDNHVPVYLIGGVIAHHPFLSKVISQKINTPLHICPQAQSIVSIGAAFMALEAAAMEQVAKKEESNTTKPIISP